MLHLYKDILGSEIDTKDRNIGELSDLFYHNELWAVRYIVVETNNWIEDKLLLISPYMFIRPEWSSRKFIIDMISEILKKKSAVLFSNKQEKQSQKLQYLKKNKNRIEETETNPNLISLTETLGFNILANNGEIGNLENYILDDKTWMIHYLVANTTNRINNQKILITPQWIEEVDLINSQIFLDISKENVKNQYNFVHSSLFIKHLKHN